MDSISTFRGYAGQVVYDFLQPWTWFSVFPVFLILFFANLFAGILLNRAGDNGQIAIVVGLFFVHSTIVGRFAVGSAHGDVSSGFFSSETSIGDSLSFGLRHVVATIVWELPVFGALYFTGQSGFMLAFLDPLSVASGGAAALVAIVLTTAVFLIPFVAYVVALNSESVGTALRPQTWAWVLLTRRMDFVSLLAAVIGGTSLYYIVYFVPMLIVFLIFASVSPEVALMSGIVLFFVIISSLSILTGRLVGAFAYGDEPLKSSRHVPPAALGLGITRGPLAVSQASAQAMQAPMPPPVSAEGPSFIAAEGDPPAAVLQWVRDCFPGIERIQSAYLCARQGMGGDRDGPVIALATDAELSLGERQKMIKSLTEQLRTLGAAGAPNHIILVDGQMLADVEAVGLRIYRRK